MMTQAQGIALSRHDVSLAGIGVVLLVGLLVGLLSAVELSRALFAASVPAAGGVFYTLFYRPPEPTTAKTKP